MNLPERNKTNIKKIVFLILLLNIYLLTHITTANANELLLDNSEKAFSGSIFWPEFIQNCGTDSYSSASGELQDIQAEIYFNFDTGTITGTFSAKHVDEEFAYTYKEDHTVQGTINGIIEKKNDYGTAGFWYMEFSGEVDFTVHYHMELKCNDDTGSYWVTEDHTLNKKGVLTGQTWGELWWLKLDWEDQETRDGRSRNVQLSIEDSDSQLVFPKPIDLEVSITMQPEVNLNSDPTPFQLNVEGRDVNMIDHFEWYFAYWNPDFEMYRGLQNEQHFETQGTESLQVTDAMRNEWRRLVNEYGFEVDDGTEIDLQINLRTIDMDGKDLVENVAFEYTYHASLGSEDTSGSESTGGETDTTDTGTSSIPVVGGEVSAGLPNLSGTMIQGAVSAGAGFGFLEIYRRYFGKTSKGAITSSDLKMLREKMKQLPPEPEPPNTGSVQGEDVLRLPTEDRFQKRDRKRSRLTYRLWKKKFDDDVFYRKRAETKKWTPEQEKKAIRDAKPNWVNAYIEEFKSKRKGIWVDSTKFWDHYKTLSDSQKFEVDTWGDWSRSWTRRHGAGTVGNLKDGRTAQFMATAGSRA